MSLGNGTVNISVLLLAVNSSFLDPLCGSNESLDGLNVDVECRDPGEVSSADEANSAAAIDYVKVTVLSGIIALTIVGNAGVVMSILVRRGKVSRMYFFILHLSVADILTAFFTLLPEVVWTFTFPKFYGGDALCKLVKFGQVFGPYLSSYTLVMTAVDRYQVRVTPN